MSLPEDESVFRQLHPECFQSGEPQYPINELSREKKLKNEQDGNDWVDRIKSFQGVPQRQEIDNNPKLTPEEYLGLQTPLANKVARLLATVPQVISSFARGLYPVSNEKSVQLLVLAANIYQRR